MYCYLEFQLHYLNPRPPREVVAIPSKRFFSNNFFNAYFHKYASTFGGVVWERESPKLLVVWGLVELHNSYFAYNKKKWQDISMSLGMFIRICNPLLILPNIPWISQVSSFLLYLNVMTVACRERTFFTYASCEP